MRFFQQLFRPVKDGSLRLFGRLQESHANQKNLREVYSKLKHFGEGSHFHPPFYITNPQYISIGKGFSCLWNLRLEAWDDYQGQKYSPELIIGDNVHVNSDVHIGCINRIVIGNNVLMGSRIFIGDHSHGEINANALALPPVERPLVSKGQVIIEDNVWIGEGACILAGVTIGKNAIIGANSVVTKNIPANSVVAGIPAKVISQLLNNASGEQQ